MFQTYVITPGRVQIDQKATFFRYETVNGGGLDETIRVRADNQDLGTLLPGDAVRLEKAAIKWEVVPVTASLQPVVRLGVGDVQSARIAGVVRVVDQGAEKTLGGSQFFGSFSAAASVGFGSIVMLSATGGSGKSVALKGLSVASPTAGNILMYRGTGAGTVAMPLTAIASKLMFGTAAGSARAGGATIAAASPSGAEIAGLGNYGYRIYVPANTQTVVPISTPIVIPAGNVLMFSAEALNREISVALEVEEL